MNIIRELYNGGLIPADGVGVNSRDYLRVREQTYTAQLALRAKMPPELLRDFDKLTDLYLSLLIAGQEEGFVEGVRFGTLLISEVHSE